MTIKSNISLSRDQMKNITGGKLYRPICPLCYYPSSPPSWCDFIPCPTEVVPDPILEPITADPGLLKP